jgi:O-antigen/teichoic acid export membrane protein
MLSKILSLGKETAIYGLSTVVGRMLNFLLVPFYTNFLLPSEYGVIANIYAYIAFAFVVYCYGMEQAYMRFVSSLEMGDKRQNFSTPFFSLVATSSGFSLLIQLFSGTIGHWIGVPESRSALVQYGAWILFFDTLAVVPFASLRMEQRPTMFAALKLSNIVFTIILNVICIVLLGMKSEGVLLANLIASALTFGAVLAVASPLLTPKFLPPLYKGLLRFGLPLIPAGLAGSAIQVIDRPIVKALTNDATLGVYQANYRLGIFMMLVVGMFDYAWRPFFLNQAREPDAKQLFARVFTYAFIALTSVFLVVTFYLEDIVRIHIGARYFIHPNYWPGLPIVPVILLSYMFTGFYVLFIVGVYLEKKTQYLPIISGGGAIVNVVLNFTLIPRYGLMGAAYATLCAYVVMAVSIYFVSQRFYRVNYEWSKVLRTAIAGGVALASLSLVQPEPGTFSGVLTKAGFLAFFFVLVVVLRVVEKSEMTEMRARLARLL